MTSIKSSYEIALEKIKGMGIDESIALTEEQKQRVADIRRECEAKVAEKRILLQFAEELPEEIRKLESRRDEKIAEIYQEAREQNR